MNGDQLMAKLLKQEGVEWLSCFPAQSLIEACAQEGIRPILCRQERAGVNMADAYSRIHNGNKIGVFTMQQGPGAENAFGGVAQAYADNVPILVIPGGAPARRLGVHPGFDAVPNYQHITKWAGRINMVERIPEMVSRAFTQLRHGRPGPVLLELPGDVARAEVPADIEPYTPVKTYKSYAATEDVRDIVTALLKANKPMINAGQGVLYAEATEAFGRVRRVGERPRNDHAVGQERLSGEPPARPRGRRQYRHVDGRPFPAIDRLCARHRHEFYHQQLHRAHAVAGD